jgi:hypothetical protein
MRTVNDPLVVYVWLGELPIAVFPSPKYHFQETAFAEDVAWPLKMLPFVVKVNEDVTGAQAYTVSPKTAESPQAFFTINRT